MKPLVTDLWPQFGEDSTFAASFAQVLVDRVEQLRQSKQIHIYLRGPVPLAAALRKQLALSLASAFAGFEVSVYSLFPFGQITPSAVMDLIEELKEEGLPVNGFLDKSRVDLEGSQLTIHLRTGLHILESIGFGDKLAQRVENRTGVLPTVKLAVEQALSNQAWEEHIQQKVPVTAFVEKKQTAALKIPGLDLTDKPVEVFHGKLFKPEALQPLKDIGGEGGKVTVWGEVFASEVKGNFRKIYTVSITDYTGSVNLKVRAQEGEDCSKWEGLKPGTTLVIRGDCAFDKYERDYVVYPYDVLTVERRQREDNAPEKRVELHLHTKLSSMDGFCDPGKIVKLAHRMGHKAIAITDHGVCQGYPEAMLATDDIRKKDPDFKLIYGCEAYFVDDMIPVVYGKGASGPLSGSFVVFDTETTGLNTQMDKLIEISAVRVENGKITEAFDTFVDPAMPIPAKVVELTGINDGMVAGAPDPDTALKQFLEFAGDRVLVAHNAHGFDIPILQAAARRAGVEFRNPYIDSLPMAQALYPGLGNYKLDTVNKYLELPKFNHHRAGDDAAALAAIFCKMLEDLAAKDIRRVEDVNTGLGGNKEVLKKKYHHLIILVKNQVGLKNLYKIVSAAHTEYFFKRPRVPRSLLNQYREGLLLGSACEAGELYRAIVAGRDMDELKRIAAYYDFLEIQPLGNNEFMLRNGTVNSLEQIKDFNRKVVELGEALHRPVVATGDVHFQEPEDAIYRSIIQAGSGFKDADNQAPLYFRTTDDMLAQFDYLGPEMAYKVVIENPNRLADRIENGFRAIPWGTYPPSIEGAEQQLRDATWKTAKEHYGDPLPELVEKRLQKELDSICGHGYAVLYVIAVKLVAYSNQHGYQVGSRGSVGSSAVAHFSGISEVNSLPPHYLCPKCKHSEFITDGSVADGFDLPDKACPECGTQMLVDGHDIPFETFLGFYGDKEPDIDLNFSGEYQSSVHRYTEELFGKEFVFKAGTVSGLQDKTAYGYVKKYLEERGRTVNRVEENRLTLGCTGVKRTTGQHPGGMVVVPSHNEIYDFCPIQHPADDRDKGVLTTHFEFKYLHDTLLKLDELGHDVPTMYKYFEEMTGITMDQVPMNDKHVISLLVSTEALGVTPEQIDSKTGTFGIPELGTPFVRQMLLEAQPQSFSDLIQISGLSHGTDVWNGNAQDLIKNGTCSISEVIGCRDSIMTYLLHKGLEPKLAFNIMELTRKGKVAKNGFPEGAEEAMREHDVPEWYMDSCRKIKYMFPKAHAVAYVTMGLRIAYFKIFYPIAYYTCYLMRNADSFNGVTMTTDSVEELRGMIGAINDLEKEERERKDGEVNMLEILIEMNLRGVHIKPVDMYRSRAGEFVIDDGAILPPINSLPGIGLNAAEAYVKTREAGPFISQEDMLRRKVAKSTIEQLKQAGCLGDMPETSQVTLFDF